MRNGAVARPRVQDWKHDVVRCLLWSCCQLVLQAYDGARPRGSGVSFLGYPIANSARIWEGFFIDSDSVQGWGLAW